MIFDPQMHKNRQHPTEVECCLFCCPILLSRCRLYSFLKLLSYRHTAKAGAVLFLLRLNRILNVNDAQLGSVGSAHHNLYTFHTIYTAQGLH